MEYKSEIEVTREFSKNISDDSILYDLFHKIIDDIPVEDLKKVFNVEIIDPESDEIQSKLSDRFLHPEERKKILSLRYRNVILFRSSFIV
jgi:hypothetical protein